MVFKEEVQEEETTQQQSVEQFLQNPEVRQFVNEWVKTHEGTFTRRGITELLRRLYIEGNSTDTTELLKDAEELLKTLSGEDGLQKYLNSRKARPESRRS